MHTCAQEERRVQQCPWDSLDERLEREIEREAELRGQSFTSATAEMLGEAVRMRRVPGIVLTDRPAGRRATVAGTRWSLPNTAPAQIAHTLHRWHPEQAPFGDPGFRFFSSLS